MVIAPPRVRPSRLIDTIPDYYRDIVNWPGYDRACIEDPDHQLRFDNLVKAVERYLTQQSITEALKAVPVGERQFMRLLKVALQRSEDLPGIVGLAAFVKFKVFRKRSRTAPLQSFDGKPSAGFGGMFQALLTRLPVIEERLIAFCREKFRQNTLTPHILRVEFKEILADLVKKELLSTDEYPFGTPSMCETPLNNWYRDVFLRRFGKEEFARRNGKAAARAAQFGSGNGEAAVPQPNQLEWVIDEVTTDLHAKYEITSPLGDWEELELPRFQTIRCRTFTFGCNVTWRLVLRPQAAANDIVIMLYEAVSQVASAYQAVPGLECEPGADFPVNKFPQLKWKTPIRVYLDNALSHLADVVHFVVVTMWGGELVLGAPGNPKERANVESAIKTQATRVMHQIVSTSGSGPQDHRRKTSAVPVKFRCDVRDLRHVLHVYFKNENILPNAASHHLSPFVRLERMLFRNRLLMGEVPPDKRRPHWYSEPVIRPIHVDEAHGRLGYVNYMYATYSNDYLKTHPSIVGQKIVVRSDPNNLRVVMAYHLDGREIGELKAQGHWGQFPNDFLIRKIYGDHRRAARLGKRADDDPMRRLYRFLKEGAVRDKKLALQFAHLMEHLMTNMGEDEFKLFDATNPPPDQEPANDPVLDQPVLATGTNSRSPQGTTARSPTPPPAPTPTSATVQRINVPRIARR